MSEKERLVRQHENDSKQPELLEAAKKRTEQLRNQHEKDAASPETRSALNEVEARREAHELAEKTHEKSIAPLEAAPEKKNRGKTNKRQRDEAYGEIMKDTRSHMPAANRAFSKLIHNPAIEATSQAVGSTLARPNAILTGSVSAFVIVLGVYLVARHYGYPLSGSETLIAFAAGWLLGIIYDFLRVMITGKR